MAGTRWVPDTRNNNSRQLHKIDSRSRYNRTMTNGKTRFGKEFFLIDVVNSSGQTRFFFYHTYDLVFGTT
ncbi:hypothetical protein [Fictibacillus halophilus]|uniref:hypothetical protein n=1 Tax=Fictibacillus halophilus TaxID=1610490 RepID=UPI00339281C2